MRYRVLLALGAVFVFGWLMGARHAVAGTLPHPAAAAATAAVARPARAARVFWVTVRPGDSLWSLGRRFAPSDVDLRAWIYRVERKNGLHGSRLVPGQRLALPAA